MDGPIKQETALHLRAGGPAGQSPVDVRRPGVARGPFVFACPHSGREYPAPFAAESRLDALQLRASEDAFVDDLVAAAPTFGAPLVVARFARAYIDANRDPWELDPRLFHERPPPWAKTRSPRVAAGLGVIPRVVGAGIEIYHGKIPLAEGRRRIEACHRPYHAALETELRRAHAAAGAAVLIDCHSMPSSTTKADLVLGDRHGTSAHPELVAAIGAAFSAAGFAVEHNTPYSGGWSTERYGAPRTGWHAVQIEFNRALYLDERTVRPSERFDAVRERITTAIAAILKLEAPLTQS